MTDAKRAETEAHILTKNGIFQAQVCSTATWDEALEWLRATNPAGTSGNWQKHDGAAFAPIACAQHPERTHYMFSC
jgi:hypothetical protein